MQNIVLHLASSSLRGLLLFFFFTIQQPFLLVELSFNQNKDLVTDVNLQRINKTLGSRDEGGLLRPRVCLHLSSSARDGAAPPGRRRHKYSSALAVGLRSTTNLRAGNVSGSSGRVLQPLVSSQQVEVGQARNKTRSNDGR